MTSEAQSKEIAIAVVRHDDRFLIGQRSAAGPLPNLWEFPGGKVDPQEQPAAAAERECREETGLEVRAVSQLADIEHTYAHGRLRLYFFSCELASRDATPVEPFRWVPRAELANYEFPPANQAILAHLIAQ